MARQKRERKAYTKAERKAMILGAIAINVQLGGSWWLTSGEIAHRLKMTNSTHLRIILAEMVTDGELDARKENDPGIAGFRRLYTIPDNDVRKAVTEARRKSGMDKETKAERDSRLMLAVTRNSGQQELFKL